jgi:hypothetical protein
MVKRKTFRVLTVVAAVVLLSAYVVYSQLKQAPTVASSSKSKVLTASAAVEKTNSVRGTKDPTNSNATIRVVPLDGTNSGAGKKSEVFFPGSKSGAVFVPQTEAKGK